MFNRIRNRLGVFQARRDRHRHKFGQTTGSVQKTTQNNNTNIDAVSQGRTADIWDSAQAAGNAGAGPLLTGAAGYNTGLQAGGDLGFRAYTGDADAAKQFMNPYTSQVIDANAAGWDKINAQTMNRTNDAATRAGAFGGSRHGVAEGVALANNAAEQGRQTAGLLSSGFEGSMNRAGNAAQLGFNAAGANAGLGFGGVGDPNLWRLRMQKEGYLGPQGSQSSGAQTSFGAKHEQNWGLGL